MVVHGSVRIGGNDLDELISSHVRRKYGLIIGENTAEKVKMEIGSAIPLAKEITMEVKGRDSVSGFPKTVNISSTEITSCIIASLNKIGGAIKDVLEKTPPELSSDIIDKGIVLSGGTAMLKGIDKHVSNYTGVAVHIADEPLLCVVRGLGMALENFDVFSRSMIRKQ